MNSIYGIIEKNKKKVVGFCLDSVGWLFLYIDDVDSTLVKGRRYKQDEHNPTPIPMGKYLYLRLDKIIAITVDE